MSSLRYGVLDLPTIEDLVEASFGVRPCTFQVRSALEQLKRRNMITVAPTGAGKTLTFWIPLLFNGDGISIIITALNGLGDQNIAELKQLGIPADIEEHKYRVIIMSPELITHNKHVSALWNSKRFIARIFNITIDEGHCISEWGKEFRPEYSQLGRLRWILPPHIPFHIASATMPPRILKDVTTTLNMQRETVSRIQLSNDHPNIQLLVVEMLDSTKSVHDLHRILRLPSSVSPLGDGTQQVKFMLFCNSRRDAQHVASFLREQLPPDLRDNIVWFHSGMTQEFRAEMVEKLRRGEIWGICCTDAAGMGLDIHDIELVIQWGYTKSLCILMQRLGRGARGTDVEATGGLATKKTKCSGSGSITIQSHGVPESGHGEGGVNNSSDGSQSESDDEVEDTHRHVIAVPVAPTSGLVMESANSSQRQAEQSAPPKLLPPSSGLSEEEYESAVMDMFINAHEQSICDEVVGNSAHGLCPANNCERCTKGSLKPRYCCDVCNPQSFLLFFAPPPPKSKRAQRLKLAGYKMEASHCSLKEDLISWRQQQLISSGMDDDFYGPHLILTDKIIIRIIELSHHSKLPDVSALKAQTNWIFASEYGAAILAIVNRHFPQPSLNPVPPAMRASTSLLANSSLSIGAPDVSVTKKLRKPTRCSKCHAVGHNGRFLIKIIVL
ncbi:hypothetical protein PAXINDRAFT_17613 [Paxillus involutus ATCC 200175]|uniref:DNA 3'-5' helicase n=1 Tax=Paxillus involutus ATCC 200175 TaxID=664439 RepID=A0A0C9T0R7_PAXIN|nr:hypothetical protein PAXINDRAFT_17613 [Paxillus involutus ATCC 200175]